MNEALTVALAALVSAQSHVATYRPSGSSDPESSAYDHDAFMWDYYQRAIDSCRAALASAPETEDHPLMAQMRVLRGTIGALLAEAMDVAVKNGADSRSIPDEYVALALWLNHYPAAPHHAEPTK